MNHIISSSCGKDASGSVVHCEATEIAVTNVVLGNDVSVQAPLAEDYEFLVSEAAHDFKNILYVIKGFTELALDHVQKDTRPHTHLKMILSAADRGARIVNQMLYLSQTSQIERHPIDIVPVVEETVAFVRASVPETISVQLTLSDGMGTVLANPTEIHQLVMNLCSNAAHAMQDNGGLLHVAVCRVELQSGAPDLDSKLKPGPYLKLTVSDSGSGVDPQVAERMFEPYVTTKKNGQGTGLGLCVVQRILRGHGGAITVESEPGKGTTCHAFLPTVECAYPSCSLRRMASYNSRRKELGMGLLREDLQLLRTDMKHIQGDIEHLEKDIQQSLGGWGSYLARLRNHVRDLDVHLHAVLAHVMHGEESTELGEEHDEQIQTHGGLVEGHTEPVIVHQEIGSERAVGIGLR